MSQILTLFAIKQSIQNRLVWPMGLNHCYFEYFQLIKYVEIKYELNFKIFDQSQFNNNIAKLKRIMRIIITKIMYDEAMIIFASMLRFEKYVKVNSSILKN